MAEDVSPEANVIRDEIRSALVALDVATDRLTQVLAHAEAFVRGARIPEHITTVAPRRSPGGYIRTPATPPGASIRE